MKRGTAAKRLLASGQDPVLVKKISKVTKASAANTFDAVAAELLDKKRQEGKADQTLTKIEWLFSLASPAMGLRPVAELSASEVLPAPTTGVSG